MSSPISEKNLLELAVNIEVSFDTKKRGFVRGIKILEQTSLFISMKDVVLNDFKFP